MKERVVENWLVNANERQYQIPFCQVLASENETVLYISRHGQMELGKDVVTVLADGTPRAYQLKAGNIGQSELRAIWGELEELVRLNLNYPQLQTNVRHESYLVTNGELTDPAINHIKEANLTWAKQGLGPLQVIQKDMLLPRFEAAHGKFFPHEIEDLNAFLELYVRDGSKPQDKRSLSKLLAISAGLSKKKMSALDVKRAAASVMLLTSYLDGPSQRTQNHWRSFENWTIAASTIGAIATKFDVKNSWQFSFDEAIAAAVESLKKLKDECISAKRPYVASPFSEGYIYPFRLSLLSALLSAYVLYHELTKKNLEDRAQIINWIESQSRDCQIAGECYVLYTLVSCLARELNGNQLPPERTAFSALHLITYLNSPNGRGLPNLYYGPEESLRFMLGRDSRTVEQFQRYSYMLESLVIYLAKRLNRTALKSVWYQLTNFSYLSFVPADNWDWFTYEAQNGVLRDTEPGRPERWSTLLESASRKPESLPAILLEKPWFSIFLALVYPHRWSPEMLRGIESEPR